MISTRTVLSVTMTTCWLHVDSWWQSMSSWPVLMPPAGCGRNLSKHTGKNVQSFKVLIFILIVPWTLYRSLASYHRIWETDYSLHHWERILSNHVGCLVINSYSASHDNWCTETLWNMIITAQCEGMGEVGSARYEPALLPPCPSIRVLSYSNCQRSTHFSRRAWQCKC